MKINVLSRKDCKKCVWYQPIEGSITGWCRRHQKEVYKERCPDFTPIDLGDIEIPEEVREQLAKAKRRGMF